MKEVLSDLIAFDVKQSVRVSDFTGVMSNKGA
jgi:hypothetical protein